MYSSVNGVKVHDQRAVLGWHALYTRHQHEKAVAQTLSSMGHEVFLPLVSATHQWQDRAKHLSLPLFPCYVFIRGGLDRPVQVLSTPGLIHVVGWAGHPASIPQNQIDAVRQVIASRLRVEPHPFLQTGDRVRVDAGPLQGIEGVLIRKKNAFRLVVSVEMLGKSAAVEIDVTCTKRIDEVPAVTPLRSRSASASA